MSDRRFPRPRSPPLYHPGRSSLPVFNSYGASGELHAVPTRREVLNTPRSSNDRVNAPGPVVTTYKIKPEGTSRTPSVRAGSRTRRSTLDGAPRPVIVTPHDPRYAAMQSARPASPLHNPYRSSDEGEYYAIPSSSGRHRGHSRQPYSATMDNADMQRMAREYGPRSRPLEGGGGRERLAYPRSRYHDAVVDDYGDDGFGYTNPRDLVEYDLNRSKRYPAARRDSFEGSRGRPSSIAGYADVMPKSYDGRERGPPPSMRGFDKLPPRYDAPPPPRPAAGRLDPYDEPPRSSRRPVSVYHEPDRHRRDDYYDQRDDDLRERREKPRRPEHERYDDMPDQRGYSGRSERGDRNDYDRRHDYDKHDHDRKDDHEDRHDRKRDLIATGLSLAGAALGINTAKNALDDERDDREEPRRRKEGDEEARRRRDRRDEAEPVDLAGRDPKERYARDERGLGDQAGRGSPREARVEAEKGDRRPGRHSPREERDSRDEVRESEERRRHRSDSKTSPPDSRDDSSASDGAGGRRPRKAHTPTTPFNPRDTMDLRALKDALNKQNTPAPPAKAAMKETVSEEKSAKSINAEDSADRGHRDGDRDRSGSEHSRERRPTTRVVSPPRETAKNPEEKPVKGILRPPRDKFPEDPMAVREGVAPLKDAKKEGIPPDARWTKISRKLVNPEALEAGKERFEARDDFVIVLRVLTKEEVQGYAAITQTIRARRQEEEEREEEEERRRRRRERHERHRRERHRYEDEHDVDERAREHRRHRRERERDSHSESDTTEDDDATTAQAQSQSQAPKMIDAPKSKKISFEDTGRQVLPGIGLDSNLKEDVNNKGVYSGYVRNPPPPAVPAAPVVGGGGRGKERD